MARLFLLKLVLALEGTPIFPTEVLREWAPKVCIVDFVLGFGVAWDAWLGRGRVVVD